MLFRSCGFRALPVADRPIAYLGNPFFLVKTRMQAYSPALPVGAQRYYRHGWHAVSTIVREEGLKGLLRGWDAAVLRGAIGGSVGIQYIFVRWISLIRSNRYNFPVTSGARLS